MYESEMCICSYELGFRCQKTGDSSLMTENSLPFVFCHLFFVVRIFLTPEH